MNVGSEKNFKNKSAWFKCEYRRLNNGLLEVYDAVAILGTWNYDIGNCSVPCSRFWLRFFLRMVCVYKNEHIDQIDKSLDR